MMEAKVWSVEECHFHINKISPPQLVVVASGIVNSSGWTNGRLIPWVYVEPPKDGIADFEFIAATPTGEVLWCMCPIEGSGTVQLQNWIKGVRVHAGSNSIVVMLTDNTLAVNASTLSGEVLPWPWQKA